MRESLIKIVLLQIVLMLGFTAIVGWAFSSGVALSFLLGEMVCIIPNGLFGRIFFRRTGAKSAKLITNAFYFGGSVKFLATVILFMLLFQWQGLNAMSAFLGFIAAQLVYWFALLKIVGLLPKCRND